MNMNTVPGFKEILPLAETEYQAMIRQFAVKSAELTTRFIHLFGIEETIRTLKTLALQEKWKSLASHHTNLTHSLGYPQSASPLDRFRLFYRRDGKVDASVTCDALVARTEASSLIPAPAAAEPFLSFLLIILSSRLPSSSCRTCLPLSNICRINIRMITV